MHEHGAKLTLMVSLRFLFVLGGGASLFAILRIAFGAWPLAGLRTTSHFYRDFLPKILLLEEEGIDPALQVIVEDRLFDQPFFQEAIQSKRLSRWSFMSPRGRFIKAKSVVFCSANQFFLLDRFTSPELNF